jgi:DNA polymerase (family 10)
MARRQSADRDEAGADDGSAGARGFERLARIFPDYSSTPLPAILEQLALLATIRGDFAEEAALTGAAALLRSMGIESDADLGPLLDHPPADIDPGILARLQHLTDSASWILIESALADLPTDLRWLLESGAVSLEQIAVLHRDLGIASAGDMMAAVSDHAIRDLATLDGAVERAVSDALPTLRRSVPRIPLGRAVMLTDPILDRLRSVPGVPWASAAGSLRRGQDTVGDIELVAAAGHPERAIEELLRMPQTVRQLQRSERRLYVVMDRVQVGIRLPEPAHAAFTLLQTTGSAAHLDALRARATAAGLRLTRDGLRLADGALLTAASEEEFYSALGLPFIAPEIRDGEEAVEAAARGTLPALLSRSDIRGDLHMHTEFSDGRDTVDAMVETCRSLGYEYLAITDHSPRSSASRNLSAQSIEEQADQIARLRERYPDIDILHGCEVDILPDGRLDFSDRILERLDIVLASLHERAGSSRDDLLRRYRAAMEHPLVTLITHPTNRLVPYRPGYDLDYDALFDVAVETGTIVEIDGSPAHLDLDGALARRAIAAGATLAVDSDCHRAEFLNVQMNLGVTTARRGWVERRHVINTRPAHEIRAAISAKRRR